MTTLLAILGSASSAGLVGLLAFVTYKWAQRGNDHANAVRNLHRHELELVKVRKENELLRQIKKELVAAHARDKEAIEYLHERYQQMVAKAFADGDPHGISELLRDGLRRISENRGKDREGT